MVTLSALVVAHNEEQRIGLCLERLQFADERVVVCDRCNDATASIAQSHGAIVIEGAWPLEGERRNTGLAACSSDFILEVDADEWISPELASEIRQVISNPAGDYFLIPFDNYIGKRRVRHGWGGSFGVRRRRTLFRRGLKHWGNERVHPKVVLRGQSGGLLKNPIDHLVDQDLTDMFNRLNRYTSLKAQDLLDAKAPGSLWPNIRRLFSRFFLCYIRRQGYKEGIYGLSIALCAGLFPLISWLKARELMEKSDV